MEGFLEARLVIFKVLDLALIFIDCHALDKLGCCYYKLFFVEILKMTLNRPFDVKKAKTDIMIS